MLRILILDDDFELATHWSRGLQEFLGAEVFVAVSAEEAMSAARAGGIDLFIVDVFLTDNLSWHDVGGITFIAGLRNGVIGQHRETPIIAVSGSRLAHRPAEESMRADRPTFADRLIGVGANAFMAKPFSIEELVERCRPYLSESPV